MHRVYANLTAPSRLFIHTMLLLNRPSTIKLILHVGTLRIMLALTLEWMVVLFLPLEDKNTQSHNKIMKCKDSIQHG